MKPRRINRLIREAVSERVQSVAGRATVAERTNELQMLYVVRSHVEESASNHTWAHVTPAVNAMVGWSE